MVYLIPSSFHDPGTPQFSENSYTTTYSQVIAGAWGGCLHPREPYTTASNDSNGSRESRLAKLGPCAGVRRLISAWILSSRPCTRGRKHSPHDGRGIIGNIGGRGNSHLVQHDELIGESLPVDHIVAEPFQHHEHRLAP